jgi:hypothetical protein
MCGLERFGGTRPPASTVKLVGGGEQQISENNIHLDARILLVPELVVEGRLGGAFLSYRVLVPVGFADFFEASGAVVSRHIRWSSKFVRVELQHDSQVLFLLSYKVSSASSGPTRRAG